MDNFGLSEMLVIGVVALLFIGPERLPHAARELGRFVGRVRRIADELRRALVLEADRMDEAERLKELRRRRAEALEERRRMAEAHGSVAQPDPHGPPAEEAGEGEGGEEAAASTERPVQGSAGTPPGFTDEEWNELPPHIRELVLRRRGEL